MNTRCIANSTALWLTQEPYIETSARAQCPDPDPTRPHGTNADNYPELPYGTAASPEISHAMRHSCWCMPITNLQEPGYRFYRASLRVWLRALKTIGPSIGCRRRAETLPRDPPGTEPTPRWPGRELYLLSGYPCKYYHPPDRGEEDLILGCRLKY